MSSALFLIAALIALPAAGLAAWVSLAMAQVEEHLCSIGGFEVMHFAT